MSYDSAFDALNNKFYGVAEPKVRGLCKACAGHGQPGGCVRCGWWSLGSFKPKKIKK